MMIFVSKFMVNRALSSKTYMYLSAGLLSPLTPVLLNPSITPIENSIDPDYLASEQANYSGYTRFSDQRMNP